MRAAVSALALALAACAPASDDPTEGGFFNGVAGVVGGGYQVRVTEREDAVAAAESRQAALSAELAGLEREHAELKSRIIQQRAALRTQGLRLSPATEGAIQEVIAAEPDAVDPATRAAALQRAIADARRLSDQLAALAG